MVEILIHDLFHIISATNHRPLSASTASRYGKCHVLISMYHFNRMVFDDCQTISML